MRKDITEGVRKYIMDEIKPNFAAIARQFNADYRTVKAAYERELKKENGLDKVSRNKRKSKLDPYKSIIDEKIVIGCTAISIFKFIQKLGFDGGYTIVKSYCKTYKDEKRKKATIRVHHVPAVAAQVDWKEDERMISKHGEIFTFNIFLYVLTYSWKKFITLTFDKKHPSNQFGKNISIFEVLDNSGNGRKKINSNVGIPAKYSQILVDLYEYQDQNRNTTFHLKQQIFASRKIETLEEAHDILTRTFKLLEQSYI